MNKLYHLMILFLAALMPFAASAQSGTVKGTVTDESGLPVIGAGVVVKGTTKGTITDIDGLYSIAADQGQTLVFTSIGYVEQEIVVGVSSEINVVLKPSKIIGTPGLMIPAFSDAMAGMVSPKY